MLSSDRNPGTMLHGLLLNGGALMLLVAALSSPRVLAPPEGANLHDNPRVRESR